ncbi:YegP family protein [Phaeobacter sp. JH209B]|uniref:YegP family protein n=1 Tax=Phaeobacter sp. JH209B TaxID=3112506 RepID=UPI003A84C1A0
MGEIDAAPETAHALVTWLDFIGRTTEALAWPVAVFAISLVFRKELKGIASNLRRIKIGDNEAIFADLEEAKEVAKSLDPVGQDVASSNDEHTISLMQKAEVSPTGAIVEAYKELEDRLGDLQRLADYDLASLYPADYARSRTKGFPPPATLSLLVKTGWLTKAEHKLLSKLRETRNRAAHSPSRDISVNAAKEFVRLVDTLADTLSHRFSSVSNFELYEDKEGRFRYRVKVDGQIILVSEGYKTRESAVNAIESVRKNATLEERYERKEADEENFYFNLKAANGQVIGTSTNYSSEASRENGIKKLQELFDSGS